jgi:alanine-synthesizing transaminase
MITPALLPRDAGRKPMRFSRRTNWNTEVTELARVYRLRRQAGLPIADLTASNPTRCGFTYPASLLDTLTNPRSLDYDPQPRGLLDARQAVCSYYAAHGVTLDPNQIVLTTSTSEAYSFLFRLLCDTDSEILVLQPGYPLFDFLAVLDDVCLKAAPLVYDHGWQIDPEGIRRAISPRTRAIVVVHPNNPTGHFTKPWEAAALAELCREFQLSLIVDEVFLDYGIAQASTQLETGVPHVWGPHGQVLVRGVEVPILGRGIAQLSMAHSQPSTNRPTSFASGLEGVPVFVVSGLSKIAGLPQMKAAWIAVSATVATGPDRQAALDRLEVIADTFLSMNAPVQWALPQWLSSAPAIQEQIRARVTANLSALDSQLIALPELERLAFEGGWYAVLRIPALEPDEHTVLALLERGVWVHPGYFFGLAESGWLVVSLLAPEFEFSHGTDILINYFRTHQGSNTEAR